MTECLTFDLDNAAKQIGCKPRWLADQLRAGRFPARKIANHWRMTADDIRAALDIMRRPARTETQPVTAQPTTGLSLTPTSRRRMQRGL
jgi:hypothetical protein